MELCSRNYAIWKLVDISHCYPLFPKRQTGYQTVIELLNFRGMKLENYTGLKVNH